MQEDFTKAKRIEDVLNAHQTFAKQMQQQMQQFSQQTWASAAPDKKTQLQQYEQQLRTITEAKEAAVRRYDEEIRRCNEMIARLKQEMKTEKTK